MAVLRLQKSSETKTIAPKTKTNIKTRLPMLSRNNGWKVNNKKPTNLLGQENATPFKFDPKLLESEISSI